MKVPGFAECPAGLFLTPQGRAGSSQIEPMLMSEGGSKKLPNPLLQQPTLILWERWNEFTHKCLAFDAGENFSPGFEHFHLREQLWQIVLCTIFYCSQPWHAHLAKEFYTASFGTAFPCFQDRLFFFLVINCGSNLKIQNRGNGHSGKKYLVTISSENSKSRNRCPGEEASCSHASPAYSSLDMCQR